MQLEIQLGLHGYLCLSRVGLCGHHVDQKLEIFPRKISKYLVLKDGNAAMAGFPSCVKCPLVLSPSCILSRAAESMDFRVTPTPTPTPASKIGSDSDSNSDYERFYSPYHDIEVHNGYIFILPETIPCAFQGFALQICIKKAFGIKKQVLGNPPSSAAFAENVRPKQIFSIFFSKKI